MTAAALSRGPVIVHLIGEHDISTESIDAATLAIAAGDGDGDVMIDLREVTFMSVGTVDTLTQLSDSLQTVGRHLVLRGLSPSAKLVLAVTGSTLTVEVEHPTPQSGALCAVTPS